MGFYATQFVPRLINVACNTEATRMRRKQVCSVLKGRVLEVGFGSGLNVPFYPDSVDVVDAVDPADVGWRLAAHRIATSPVPIRRSGLDGQLLPFPDASFDMALSAWTLCTIPEVGAALREVRRVLKPLGALQFIEHGLAPDANVRRRQHRFEPVQKRIAGGCHLTRPIPELLTAAGFRITELETYYEKGSPRIVAAEYLGTAIG